MHLVSKFANVIMADVSYYYDANEIPLTHIYDIFIYKFSTISVQILAESFYDYKGCNLCIHFLIGFKFRRYNHRSRVVLQLLTKFQNILYNTRDTRIKLFLGEEFEYVHFRKPMYLYHSSRWNSTKFEACTSRVDD